jgi:hypothetical protein
MYDAEDIEINVQAPPPMASRGRQPRAQVMFTEAAAVAVYRQIYLRDFPLSTTATRVRYGLYQEDVSADSSAYISFAPSPASRRSSVSSATSDDSMHEPTTPTHNLARDYVFTFGVNIGKRFTDVDDNYLKTIGGQLYKYMDKHVGLLQAFEYHRPGQARIQPPHAERSQTQPQPTRAQPSQPRPQPPQPRQLPTQNSQPPQSQAPSASDTWRFKKGIHQGKRLQDVPENYIRTVENNPLVRNAWPGFKQAVQDFNAKTGRQGRI